MSPKNAYIDNFKHLCYLRNCGLKLVELGCTSKQLEFKSTIHGIPAGKNHLRIHELPPISSSKLPSAPAQGASTEGSNAEKEGKQNLKLSASKGACLEAPWVACIALPSVHDIPLLQRKRPPSAPLYVSIMLKCRCYLKLKCLLNESDKL